MALPYRLCQIRVILREFHRRQFSLILLIQLSVTFGEIIVALDQVVVIPRLSFETSAQFSIGRDRGKVLLTLILCLRQWPEEGAPVRILSERGINKLPGLLKLVIIEIDPDKRVVGGFAGDER